MIEASLDPEKQEQAREYAHIRRRLFVGDLALAGIYVILWLVTGWSWPDLCLFLEGFTS
jgi:hypothetical protein